MDALRQDLRYALRQLRRRPAYAAIAVATLALGIGANAAVFSVVDAVVLRGLPYPEPDRLVRLWSAFPERDATHGAVSPADLADWREQASSIEEMAGWPSVPISGLVLVGDEAPQELSTTYVTEGFFATLGIGARLGRTLTPEDHAEGRNRVAVLSHGAWRRHFGGDPGLVGSTVTLSGDPFTVAGVMPEGFEFPDAATEVWAPLSLIPESGVPRLRVVRWLSVVGRLAPDVKLATAGTEMSTIAARLAQGYPDSNEDLTAVTLSPLRDEVIGPVRPAMLAALGAVALVLLIACANVASLALARFEERSREIGLRAALGAGRRRIARQLLAESLVLAAAGGAAGVLLGAWGARALVALAPADLPRLASAGVDPRLLGFAAAVTLLTALLFGLAPSLRASRPDLRGVLLEGGRGAAGAGRSRLRDGLVVGQVALVAVLAVGAGLLVRSYDRLSSVDPGFRTEGVLTFLVNARGDDHRQVLWESLERIRELPGVQDAALVRPLPLRHDAFQGEGISFRVVGRPPAPDDEAPEAVMRFVSPGYFRTLGIPLLAGRDFTDRDDAEAPFVVILSREAAERYWPGESAVGARIAAGDTEGEVIGVVDDVAQEDLAEEPEPAFYVAHRQISRRGMTFVVRAQEPAALVGPIQRTIRQVASEQPIDELASMASIVASSTARPRFSSALMGAFAALALVLAAVGIYGTLSYAVSRREREIGVRMALGARPTDVLGLVARRGLGLAAAGVGLGLAVAALATRLLRDLLFGVAPLDPWSFAGAGVLLLAVAAAASLLPALRAGRLDPLTALREE